MKYPGIAFQQAAITAIETKMDAQGWTGDRVLVDPAHDEAFPYVVHAGDTTTEWHTKTTEGAELTHSFTCWSDSMGQAQLVANEVIEALTDRDAPLSITGYSTVRTHLDFVGPLIKDDINTDDIRWGVPVRFRYIVFET